MYIHIEKVIDLSYISKYAEHKIFINDYLIKLNNERDFIKVKDYIFGQININYNG